MYHSDIDVLFSYFFEEVCNRPIVASIYMLNDPRYIVAYPRYTISVLHILPSHTFEYRAREKRKKELLTRAALLEPIHIQCRISFSLVVRR